MKIMWMVGFFVVIAQYGYAQDTRQPMPPAQTPPITKPAPLPNSVPPAPVATVPAVPDPKAGKFRFKEETYDFGEITEGDPAECDFEFRNKGKKAIIISEAHGSCGCTVPNWPREPILPKHKGVIHVTYNTRGRVGPINKDVIITSNAVQSPVLLHITGTVVPRPYEPPTPAPPPVPAAPPVN